MGNAVPFGVQFSDKFGLGTTAVVLYLRDSGVARESRSHYSEADAAKQTKLL